MSFSQGDKIYTEDMKLMYRHEGDNFQCLIPKFAYCFQNNVNWDEIWKLAHNSSEKLSDEQSLIPTEKQAYVVVMFSLVIK
jgi:hypothetical protein